MKSVMNQKSNFARNGLQFIGPQYYKMWIEWRGLNLLCLNLSHLRTSLF